MNLTYAAFFSFTFITLVFGGQWIHTNPFKPKKEPWLVVKDGFLATENTSLYIATVESNGVKLANYTMTIGEILRQNQAMFLGAISDSDQYEDDLYENPYAGGNSYPDIVYPEILVAVSYDLYKKFNLNVFKMVQYVLAFWNGVDMKFRSIENPKFRLNIAGIVLEQEQGALRYLNNSFQGQTFLEDTVMGLAMRYWYRMRKYIPLRSYDAVVTMTPRLICSKWGVKGRYCLSSAAGMAQRLAGMCHDLHSSRRTQKVIIFEDRGGYDGISTAAHELGHLLGADHDIRRGAADSSELCLAEFGYMMSPVPNITENQSDWTVCSFSAFKLALDKGYLGCIFNKPIPRGKILPRYLPGKLMSAEEQCRIVEGTKSCKNMVKESICLMRHCYRNDICQQVIAPAPAGTPCGDDNDDKMCIHSKCLSESSFS